MNNLRARLDKLNAAQGGTRMIEIRAAEAAEVDVTGVLAEHGLTEQRNDLVVLINLFSVNGDAGPELISCGGKGYGPARPLDDHYPSQAA